MPAKPKKKKKIVPFAHPARRSIYKVVESNPGIHFCEIYRKIGGSKQRKFSRSNIARHANILNEIGMLSAVHDGYRKRFYTAGQPIKKELHDNIYEVIADHDSRHKKGIRMMELVERLGVSERVIRYHLEKIPGKIEKRREGKHFLYLPRK